MYLTPKELFQTLYIIIVDERVGKGNAIGRTVQNLVFRNKSDHLRFFDCSQDLCEDASCQISLQSLLIESTRSRCLSAPLSENTNITSDAKTKAH